MSEEVRAKSEELKELKLVVPTKEEFDLWIMKNGFTSLCDILRGYAIVYSAHEHVDDNAIEDPEHLIHDAINIAEEEIEKDLFNLFVCALKDFAEKEGGAK